jgi:hypothetical protein
VHSYSPNVIAPGDQFKLGLVRGDGIGRLIAHFRLRDRLLP